MRRDRAFLKILRDLRGFTLSELMVAVAVVGVLSMMASHSYRKMQMNAKQTEAKSELAGLYTAMESFNAESGQYSTRLDAVGFQPNGNMKYAVGFSADVPPPVGSYNMGTATCLSTGPGNPACNFVQTWTNDASLVTIPGLPAWVVNGSQYTGFALGRTDGTNIDSWSINNRKQLINTNPMY